MLSETPGCQASSSTFAAAPGTRQCVYRARKLEHIEKFPVNCNIRCRQVPGATALPSGAGENSSSFHQCRAVHVCNRGAGRGNKTATYLNPKSRCTLAPSMTQGKLVMAHRLPSTAPATANAAAAGGAALTGGSARNEDSASSKVAKSLPG